MKIIVIKTNLKSGLGIIERAVGENTNLPILKNILIAAVQNKIRLVATNLEIAITAHISGKVTEDGSITLPAALFLNIVNNLQSERLNLETQGNILAIVTDNYSATLQGAPPEEFPIIPAVQNTKEHLEIKGALLKETLTQTLISTQLSAIRTELNTILIDFNLDALKWAGTDSFRLSEKTINKNQLTSTASDGFKALLPLKTAQELLRIIRDEETITICRDQSQILFTTPSFELISRLASGNFPNYQAIVPQKFDTEVIVSRAELMHAVKLVGVMSDATHEVKIKLSPQKKTIELHSLNQSLGENTYTLPAKIKGNAFEIGFNWRYLADGLRALPGEEMFLGLNENNKPGLLKSINDASYFYVLMPILKA